MKGANPPAGRTRDINCAFCKGTGKNPHFEGTCPVCKGKGENQITGKYMACDDCRGSGQKRGTTLTCYTCAGLGVIPDPREELRQARQEIRKIQGEMGEERTQLTEKQPKASRKANHRQQQVETRFCQSCAKSIKGDDLVKVCLKCFKKIKQGSL